MSVKIVRKGEIHSKLWGYELWISNNDKYCGKLLVFNKDSNLSLHYHLIKQETWYVSKGEFEFSWVDTKNGNLIVETIKEGDVVDICIGQPHQLKALTQFATIFEVSTEHFENDSYRITRKTNINL
jgi:mannose-6-phosphate isomerase-like protein (cupin superfamily)